MDQRTFQMNEAATATLFSAPRSWASVNVRTFVGGAMSDGAKRWTIHHRQPTEPSP